MIVCPKKQSTKFNCHTKLGQVINIVNRVTGPYDVNSFAVIAAFAALKDQSYIDSYVNKVLEARNWLKIKLEK